MPFPSGTEHTRQSEDSHPGGPAWSEPSLALSGARGEGKGWWEGGVSGAIRGGKVSAAAKQGRETEAGGGSQSGGEPERSLALPPPDAVAKELRRQSSRGQQGTAGDSSWRKEEAKSPPQGRGLREGVTGGRFEMSKMANTKEHATKNKVSTLLFRDRRE